MPKGRFYAVWEDDIIRQNFNVLWPIEIVRLLDERGSIRTSDSVYARAIILKLKNPRKHHVKFSKEENALFRRYYGKSWKKLIEELDKVSPYKRAFHTITSHGRFLGLSKTREAFMRGPRKMKLYAHQQRSGKTGEDNTLS